MQTITICLRMSLKNDLREVVWEFDANNPDRVYLYLFKIIKTRSDPLGLCQFPLHPLPASPHLCKPFLTDYLVSLKVFQWWSFFFPKRCASCTPCPTVEEFVGRCVIIFKAFYKKVVRILEKSTIYSTLSDNWNLSRQIDKLQFLDCG